MYKNNKNAMMLLLLFFSLCSSSCMRDYNREIELLEMERIQLREEQELIDRAVAPKAFSSKPYFFPMQDSQSLNIYVDSQLWD